MKFSWVISSLALCVARGYASLGGTARPHLLHARFTDPNTIPECQQVCAQGNGTVTSCPDDGNLTLACSCPQANAVNQVLKECFECGFRVDPDADARADSQALVDRIVQVCNNAGYNDVHPVTIELPEKSAATGRARGPRSTAVRAFAVGGAVCAFLGGLSDF